MNSYTPIQVDLTHAGGWKLLFDIDCKLGILCVILLVSLLGNLLLGLAILGALRDGSLAPKPPLEQTSPHTSQGEAL